MEKESLISLLGVSDILDIPSAIMQRLFSPQVHDFFRSLAELPGWEWDKDSFQLLYEREMSERKDKKQDFTPDSVRCLLVSLCNSTTGSTHEPTAGNGGLLIAQWWYQQHLCYPWEYNPGMHRFDCWELSERSIPILLCNLAIRGMVGVVHQGDVLKKKEIHRFILENRTGDSMGYSSIRKEF